MFHRSIPRIVLNLLRSRRSLHSDGFVRKLVTPIHAPQANTLAERVIGSIARRLAILERQIETAHTATVQPPGERPLGRRGRWRSPIPRRYATNRRPIVTLVSLDIPPRDARLASV